MNITLRTGRAGVGRDGGLVAWDACHGLHGAAAGDDEGALFAGGFEEVSGVWERWWWWGKLLSVFVEV